MTWATREEDGRPVHRIDLPREQGFVDLYARPTYCDRGQWIAYVVPTVGSELARGLDGADGFPRYYFDLERAKGEIEAWIKARRECRQ